MWDFSKGYRIFQSDKEPTLSIPMLYWSCSGEALETWKYSRSSITADTSEDTTTKLAPPLNVDLWICAEIWLIAVINVWFQSF